MAIHLWHKGEKFVRFFLKPGVSYHKVYLQRIIKRKFSVGIRSSIKGV